MFIPIPILVAVAAGLILGFALSWRSVRRGHHTSQNTAARDAVKREALRRAGVGYVEVVSGDTPAEVREMVRKLVGRVEGA